MDFEVPKCEMEKGTYCSEEHTATAWNINPLAVVWELHNVLSLQMTE